MEEKGESRDEPCRGTLQVSPTAPPSEIAVKESPRNRKIDKKTATVATQAGLVTKGRFLTAQGARKKSFYERLHEAESVSPGREVVQEEEEEERDAIEAPGMMRMMQLEERRKRKEAVDSLSAR